MPLPLRTRRLTLRAPELADVDALLEVFGDPVAMRHIGTGQVRSRDEVVAAVERQQKLLADRGFCMFVVARREDGRVLGDCGLNIWAETGEVEIGWRFAPEHWRQGYASEAAAAVFELARSELALGSLICMVYADNTPSWRIAERLGFRLDTETERHGRQVRRYVCAPAVVVRPATASDLGAVREVTAEVYVGEGYTQGDSDYLEELTNVEARYADGGLLVAEHAGRVVGAVTYCAAGSRYADLAVDREAEFRMLAVAPAARGRGAGEALVRACLKRAADEHRSAVVLSTMDRMTAAHRLYERLGFHRSPDRDWSVGIGLRLRAYVYPLADA